MQRRAEYFASDRSLAANLARWDITRVGDLTDLDVIGLPVWFAARPNSRALSVSQGKGLTHEQARVSAILEAAETAAAEAHESLVSLVAKPSQLKRRGVRPGPLERIVQCNYESMDPDVPRSWVRGHVWDSGEPVVLPFELVGIDLRTDSAWDQSCFQMSSVGLAAGASRDAAILHGLLEVIENDATVLFDFFGPNSLITKPLHAEPGHSAGLDHALGRVTAAGLTAQFFDLTGPMGIPVIGCMLARQMSPHENGEELVEAGMASRTDAQEAALAALLEAAQSRLTNIAAARDDINAAELLPVGPMPDLDLPRSTSIRSIEGLGRYRRAAEAIALVAGKLREAGFEEILVFPLSSDDDMVQVVRVIVPGLGSGATDGVVEIGERTLLQMLGGIGW